MKAIKILAWLSFALATVLLIALFSGNVSAWSTTIFNNDYPQRNITFKLETTQLGATPQDGITSVIGRNFEYCTTMTLGSTTLDIGRMNITLGAWYDVAYPCRPYAIIRIRSYSGYSENALLEEINDTDRDNNVITNRPYAAGTYKICLKDINTTVSGRYLLDSGNTYPITVISGSIYSQAPYFKVETMPYEATRNIAVPDTVLAVTKGYINLSGYNGSILFPHNTTLTIGDYKTWNYSGEFNTTGNYTNNLASYINKYLIPEYHFGGYYTVPLLFHSDTAGIINYSDMLFEDTGFFENSQTYLSSISAGSIATFKINITSSYSVNNAKFIYNNTEYISDSIDNYGSGIYILSKQISTPQVTTDANKDFYWNITLSDGISYNSTSHNQTVISFGIDNCASYKNLTINYTMYDELDQYLIQDTNIPTTAVTVNIYALDYSTLVATTSFNSSSNNTNVCLKNNLGNSSYYLDASVQYKGGSQYVSKFNHIQKYLLTNTTMPIHVPLYTLNSSLSQEFVVTFKDANFLLDPDVLVDVSRKYIPEGIFKSVEVAKTGSIGQTVIHLELSNVVYTITFKKYGVILNVLDNVIAKCQSYVLGQCEINENAFSSTLNIGDYIYNNGISVSENYDSSTRTVTANFVVQSGTKLVSLNVTKFDRFGNTTVCSDSMTSSSGVLTCLVPASFDNATIVSNIYANGVLSDVRIFSTPITSPDTSGSYVILAIMIVTTLSMLFITDVRGILLGCFIGLILVGTLLYINQGNLFSVGTAMTWALLAVIIILWKISQKEER